MAGILDEPIKRRPMEVLRCFEVAPRSGATQVPACLRAFCSTSIFYRAFRALESGGDEDRSPRAFFCAKVRHLGAFSFDNFLCFYVKQHPSREIWTAWQFLNGRPGSPNQTVANNVMIIVLIGCFLQCYDDRVILARRK